MLLGGFALGLLVTPLVATSVAAAPAYSGVVGGLNNASRQTGTSMGVAIFGALAGPTGAATAASRIGWCFVLGALVWAVAGLAAGARRPSR
jgi:DHA2 family methylenomycin A resistance protein-like MFS transporter